MELQPLSPNNGGKGREDKIRRDMDKVIENLGSGGSVIIILPTDAISKLQNLAYF